MSPLIAILKNKIVYRNRNESKTDQTIQAPISLRIKSDFFSSSFGSDSDFMSFDFTRLKILKSSVEIYYNINLKKILFNIVRKFITSYHNID